MKTEGILPVAPPPGPAAVLRVEGKIEVPVTIRIGEVLQALVERVLPEGRALVNFGSFSLLARTTTELVEGEKLQLIVERFAPSMELKILAEPTLPDVEDLARAVGAFIRDAAPRDTTSMLHVGLDPIDHPMWKAGVESLSRAIQVLVGPDASRESALAAGADVGGGAELAEAVRLAVARSGVFLEARAVRTATEIEAAFATITTIVDTFHDHAAVLIRTLPETFPESAPAASPEMTEVTRLLAALPRLPASPTEAVKEFLNAPQMLERLLDLVPRILAQARSLAEADPQGPTPAAKGSLQALASLVTHLGEAARDVKRALADFAEHVAGDQKAALLQMATAAREAGRSDVVDRLDTALRLIEGFQGATLAQRPAAGEGPFVLIPLPVMTPDGRHMAELKVFYRERDGGPRFDPENLSVSLLLQLSHLGRLRADARINGRKVQCNMWLDNGAVQAYVDLHLSHLRDALSDAGFADVSVSSTVDNRKVDEFHDHRASPSGGSKLLDVKI